MRSEFVNGRNQMRVGETEVMCNQVFTCLCKEASIYSAYIYDDNCTQLIINQA